MAADSPAVPGFPAATVDIFQLIQAHQEKAIRLPPIDEVRTILTHSFRGFLSTFSQKHQGYSSGAMVDFACDAYGSPILAISNLAAHTKDLLANPKCSLLVAKDPEDRTDLVITVHRDAILVAESNLEAIRAAYMARHPDAFWVDFADFQFLRIEPEVVTYVSGVATTLLRSGEFSNNDIRTAKVDPIYQFSKPITSHMNKDRAEDTKLIVQHYASVPVDFAYMLDVDNLGFNMRVILTSLLLSVSSSPRKFGELSREHFQALNSFHEACSKKKGCKDTNNRNASSGQDPRQMKGYATCDLSMSSKVVWETEH